MIINLTQQTICIYKAEDFKNLEQINATNWVADGVDLKTKYLEFQSEGVALIKTTVTDIEPVFYVPAVKTIYGDLTGIPSEIEITETDILIVASIVLSAAISSKHTLAKQMASPHKVVRLRKDASITLGCMGLSFR